MFQRHMPGVYTYSFDPATGKIDYLSTAQGIENRTYTAVDSTGQHLYAVGEFEGGRENLCYAFQINRETGELTLINQQATLGQASCYVTIESSGKYALVANYTSGKTWVMLPIRADGGLDAVSDLAEHVGSSVNARQDRAHGHCTVADPGNTYIFVADLGIDQLVRYKLDVANGKLIPAAEGNVKMVPGSGPRHFVFHPSGKFVYVVSELTATVTALSYDAASGTMQALQTVSTLPEGFDGQKWAAAIRITADGRFVYASNRDMTALRCMQSISRRAN